MMLAPLLLTLATANVDLGVVYSRVGGLELAMDIYRPTTNEAPQAAVVLLHGGAWMSGNRSWMAGLGKALADEGFLAASVSYRLAPTYKWPAMIEDAQTAVRYLRANAVKLSIDPARIGALGESAGGQLALLLGNTDSAKDAKEHADHTSRVAAVFDIYGPTDFSDFPRSFDPVYQLVLGKPRDQASDLIRSASPITFLSAASPPTFILHGSEDTVVPIVQSKVLHAKLRQLRVPVEAVYVDGMGHRIDGSNPAVREGVRRGIRFLKQHLGPKA